MMQYWLISMEDVHKLRQLAESVSQEYGLDAVGCTARQILYYLETGLHQTDAVPDDMINDDKRMRDAVKTGRY